MIGIAITTHNRRAMFDDTLQRILGLAPPGCPIVVVDDGSAELVTVPDRVTLYRFTDNQGIAVAKNKCLELLCETRAQHFFLFDDDTYPTAESWWEPYVASSQPHLMYWFAQGPGHWVSHAIGGFAGHVSHSTPRGCMLYVERRVLAVVGGMHTAFGKHGAEHGNWSDRIYQAGLTFAPYTDVVDPAIHCRDQDQARISSVDCREHQQWRTVDASTLARYATFRGRLPVLVPRRRDGGWRDALWSLLRNDYWWGTQGFDVVEGTHEGGAFNRSSAVNAAARAAGDWEIAVIADSDTFVPTQQLLDAVALARRTQRLVAAFDQVHEMTCAQTQQLLAGDVALVADHVPPGYAVEKIRRGSDDPTTVQSSMLVVPRAVWDEVRGFDEGFVGWGCEDNAFWRACELLTGSPLRVPGPAWHLWHPTSKPDRADLGWQRNQWRWRLYRDACSADQVRALLRHETA